MAPKPKPKYDPVTGKWVVRNWDGTVAGVEHGDARSFENLETIGTKELSRLTEASPSSSRTNHNPTSNNNNNNNHHAISEQQPAASASATTTATQQQPSRPVFARIDAVAMGSPADLAGLKEDDLILEFGPLHAANHSHLKAIAALVPQMADEQTSIPITLKRRSSRDRHNHETSTLTILLLPKPWSGRGLIGCHIVPYTLEE
jgi:hypothetical protein